MKINPNLFCLPPYISTTWNNVSSLHMKGSCLMVSLEDGEIIQIPGLNQELIDQIFEHHATYLEKEESLDKATEQLVNAQASIGNPFLQIMSFSDMGGIPFRFAMNSFDGFSQALQHNAAQAQMPDIPKEILEKITIIAKTLTPDEFNQTPQAEPHCNCLYCQIARTISSVIDPQHETDQINVDDEVSPHELSFRQWDIMQKENHLYSVTNRLDKNEQYSVFLGTPVGCTCGKPNCEHIVAVLRT